MTQRPGGMPPPERATLRDSGTELDLAALAARITTLHLERCPADVERYGDRARDWGEHDGRHILNWAVLDANGWFRLEDQLDWLAGVLEAREYPLEHLGSFLGTCAEAVGDPLAPRLRDGAAFVRARGAADRPGSARSRPR
jgi:hypothetical protein